MTARMVVCTSVNHQRQLILHANAPRRRTCAHLLSAPESVGFSRPEREIASLGEKLAYTLGQETGRTTSPSELPRNWRGTGAPELARSARDQRECRSSNGSKNTNEHEAIISSEMRAKRQVDALITVAHNTAARSWIERVRRHDGKSL